MISSTGSDAATGEEFDIAFLVVAERSFLTDNFNLLAWVSNPAGVCKEPALRPTKLHMQITAQTDPNSSSETFTPLIFILETDHGVTAKGGDSSALQTALDLRQVDVFADNSFHDRGVPMSALHD